MIIHIKFNMIILLSVWLLVTACSGLNGKTSSAGIEQSGNEKGPRYPEHYLHLDAGKDPENIITDDFNRDGLLDIAVVSHGDSCIKIFWGNGGREFLPGPILERELTGFHPDFVTAADWDKDGFTDLVLAAEGISSVVLFKNMQGVGFEKAGQFEVKYSPKGIGVADFDGDGEKDIVLGPYASGNILVLWGKNQPRFEFDISEIKAGDYASSVCISDWNLDGKPDILWTETQKYNVKVAINRGDRTFQTKTLFHRSKEMVELPRSVVTADVNEDGCVDALSPLEIGKAAVILYGDCKGGVLSLQKIKAPDWGFRGIGAIGAGKNHPAYIALGEKLRMFVGVRARDGSWHLKEYKAGRVPENFIFRDVDKDGRMDVLFVDSAGDTASIYFGPLI